MKETDNQFLKSVEKAKQRLAAGETPKNVFDRCTDFYDGFAAVRLNGKWNYIDRKGNYLSDTWFDTCGDFRKGFVWVRLNGMNYRLRNDGILCDYDTKEPIEPDHSVLLDTDYKKKYEQALERAKNYHEGHTLDVNPQAAMEYVFPELKESEDERIRKEILNVIHQLDDNTTICGRNYDFQKWITWLEKQSEI